MYPPWMSLPDSRRNFCWLLPDRLPLRHNHWPSWASLLSPPAFFLHQLFLSKSLLWGFQVGCPSDWCSCIWWPYCDNPYFGNVMITPLRLATKGRSEATRVMLDQASSGGEWDELGIIGNVGMLQSPRSHKTDALICRPIRSRKMSRQVEMEIWRMH